MAWSGAGNLAYPYMKGIRMTQRGEERTTFLADVMTTALEGGINYWAEVDDVSTVEDPNEVLGWRYNGAHLVGYEDGEGYSIDLNTIARGLNLIAAKYPASHITKGNREQDAGDIDAIDADAVVQYGLFGELVYA